uniref:Uncharacterized protein n=1 Tax=Anopheles maculatus TaxID=74869 RepID=A0A182SX68_9DIPT
MSLVLTCLATFIRAPIAVGCVVAKSSPDDCGGDRILGGVTSFLGDDVPTFGDALLRTKRWNMEDGGADPENNNSSHCGMLGISMPCEGAGHDFSTVRKELEYANAIAAHYGATEKGDRIISYKIEVSRKTGTKTTNEKLHSKQIS